MTYSKIMQSAFVFVAAVCVSGCALKAAPSGFLDDYSSLRESEDQNHLWVSAPAQADPYAYTEVLIEPVTVYFHPKAKGKEVESAKLEEFSLMLESRIAKTFAQQYVIASEPGKDVLRLKTVITDVVPSFPLLNIAPHHTLATGVGLGGAAVEAEFVDSLTGEQILALRYVRKGFRRRYFKGWTKWGHAEDVLNDWADILYTQINKVNESGQAATP